MLGIGKLGAGAEDYYLSAVAAGREDYYLREGEAPGRWVGQGARSFGLAGEVEGTRASRRAGRPRPRDGEQLVRGARGGRSRTPGFDLTFRAPKSVSLLFALGEPRAARPRRWHRTSAPSRRPSAYLEGHAAHLRRGAGGAERVPALGLVGAAFVHRTSRAGDPALHSHVLVANMAEDAEGGSGRSTRARSTVTQRPPATSTRQSSAISWVSAWASSGAPIEHGVADIDGVPRRVIEAFSRRRQEIEARMAERGETSARAAQAAALDTRAAKDYGVSVERLEAEWRARAAGARLRRARDRGLPVPRLGARAGGRGGRARLRRALRSAGADRRTSRPSPAARSSGRSPSASAQRGPPRSASWPIASSSRSASVLLVPEREPAEGRYSTPELLATERELLDGAIARRGEGAGQVDERTVEAVLAGRPELSDEQAAMVRGLTESGDGLQVVLGWAGSGKTYALEPAREAWEAAGYEVIGAALAARAASELEAGRGFSRARWRAF